MKIRNKILLYFSTTVISLTILSSIIIYLLFSGYREEEFQQRQKEKIKYTLGLISEYKELSENLSKIMDEHTIQDFYDEKMLIFDKHKNLIYTSIDDLQVHNAKQILNNLSPANQWLETKDGKYDIVGLYIENKDNHFYAISKAYDEFGYTKLNFLRNVLIIISILISLIVLLVTYILSVKISKPIKDLAENLNRIDLKNDKSEPLKITSNSFELNYLIEKFNQLIVRTNEAFSFQKHAVHHISHELKTPIAILVSELERAYSAVGDEAKNQIIGNQINKAKSLADIINVLLEISKIESGMTLQIEQVRLDEVIFEVMEELAIIAPLFRFEFRFEPEVFSEERLTLTANKMMVKQAVVNVMNNCISYSSDNSARIVVSTNDTNVLKIQFTNRGKTISEEEQLFLFHHFFRGNNSTGVTGFGLGLVLTRKIVRLQGGEISYDNPTGDINTFTISFPLS